MLTGRGQRRCRVAMSLLAAGVLWAGLCMPALADTIDMEELAVEGEVQKPEVLFIFDRSGGDPPVPGADRLKENLLDSIVEDAWRLANEKKNEQSRH